VKPTSAISSPRSIPIWFLELVVAALAIKVRLENTSRLILGIFGKWRLGYFRNFDVPKASPIDVVRQAYDAIETGESEVLADAGTRALKQSLSSKVLGYIDPEVLDPRDA
jgi:hypothetical protein